MDNKEYVVSLLKEIEIFSNFDNAILEDFALSMKEVVLKKGETLFYKGDKANAMYIILEGSVEVHDNNYIFAALNSKQFFGEYALIDSAVRSASVTAIHSSLLLELNQSVFEKATQYKPELWKSVLVSLVKRLRDYNIVEEKLTMRTIDIQKKKYEVELEKEKIANQKKELEAINATKDRFLAILAHDLKNPFSTVINISNNLLIKPDVIDNVDTYEAVAQINKNAKNSYNLLENILQWARSQTGSLKINFKKNHVKSIIDAVVELFEINAQQKNIKLLSEIDGELHGYFDLDMTTTVIRNLISNALKYTNQGGIVTISAVEAADMIQLEVSDTGIGMTKETVENLFKIDKTTNLNSSSENTGTGLGMALIKEFILKNGGDIWVVSEPNSGTTIKFTLPKAL